MGHHSVYVIELDRRVLKHRKFVANNPQYNASKPCVYVGSTGLAVQQRFHNHKKGWKANRYVTHYGIRLLPHLYEHYNPMPYEHAILLEAALATYLQQQGYAVWQR